MGGAIFRNDLHLLYSCVATATGVILASYMDQWCRSVQRRVLGDLRHLEMLQTVLHPFLSQELSSAIAGVVQRQGVKVLVRVSA